MSPKRTTRKKSRKKQKPTAVKKIAQKAKVAAKNKTAVKSKALPKTKAAVKSKTQLKKKKVKSPKTVQMGSQSVETVSLKPKRLAARAGAGDYQGVSAIADADSESADELLEEGQTFEAGIVSGVENAGDADEAEVTTHEVPQDDVPGEYDDKDRP
jgi:hypothetical protein